MRQKNKITNYVHITVILSLLCCFQRLTCVINTQLQLCGDNISYYVQIISDYVDLIVIMYVHIINNFVF